MKSLSDHYSSTHSSAHETFADLVFCALVVLVLFVVTLAVEVSQRVRASTVTIAEVPGVTVPETVDTLSPEEVQKLAEQLQKQQAEMAAYRQRLESQNQQIQQMRSRLAEQESAVSSKLAALQGEQRFTGATEPAGLQVAFDYDRDRFVFVRQKEFRHATTRQSGESDLAYLVRLKSELADLAMHCRQQRFYTASEINRLYEAFSRYKQINPTTGSYTVTDERIGVTYSVTLSGFIAGDVDVPKYAEAEIERAVNNNLNEAGPVTESMYPAVTVRIDGDARTATINGVTLSATDFRDLLLAIGGRGAMLDFEGYTGAAPDWLVENVLTPTGYIGKTPKLPE
ncbi:hypothetical protein [Candidatus Laterigemmans baculatus]|uniref:hypothetical protein n=1 Tax=Candidatus Laterigemmans baculatus TaxID=2770505 RepID=UPI0013DB688C|nr:hypothetical protein [Candidatus Laterigemmans baculatus]